MKIGFKIFLTSLLLISGISTSLAADKIIREFDLKFHISDYVVPEGEKWKLVWKSPYEDGAVTPAYDVRITKGSVFVGENKQTQIEAFPGTDKDHLLDFSAVSRDQPSVIWVIPGSKFGIANKRLKIHVIVFKY